MRAPPTPPGDTKDGPFSFTSEADRLRQDIERLQLSSRSSPGLDSPPSYSPIAPTTPTVSDGSSGSTRKKPEKKKKAQKDKDGQDFVKNEDLETLSELGAGNGGTVTKVWNKKRNTVMARKVGGMPLRPR
jgi:mitogen-activated protein kinase kinase